MHPRLLRVPIYLKFFFQKGRRKGSQDVSPSLSLPSWPRQSGFGRSKGCSHLVRRVAAYCTPCLLFIFVPAGSTSHAMPCHVHASAPLWRPPRHFAHFLLETLPALPSMTLCSGRKHALCPLGPGLLCLLVARPRPEDGQRKSASHWISLICRPPSGTRRLKRCQTTAGHLIEMVKEGME